MLLACWAWALALAAMPELHAWAHSLPAHAAEHECDHGPAPEGDSDDHACLATMLATGVVNAAHVAPLLDIGPMNFAVVRWLDGSRDVPALFLLASPLEHGPPARA